MRSGFGLTPQVRFNRSKFDLSHNHKTAFNMGDLVPLDLQEVIPGDSFKSKVTGVIRVTSSFIKPVMDNLYMDIHHFFIPQRLLFDDSEKVFGNPNPSQYQASSLKIIPSTFGDVVQGSIADHLGLPLGSISDNISVLPFRAYALVYDQWFRDENVSDEMFVQKGNASSSETLNSKAFAPNNYTGMLAKVRKKKDYFTTCLPNPQKGAPVNIPLGEFAPIRSRIDIAENEYELSNKWYPNVGGGEMSYTFPLSVNQESGTRLANLELNNLPSDELFDNTEGFFDLRSDSYSSQQNSQTGLVADLSDVQGVSVNDLRLAFATQKMLERDALYGSRYNEFLLGHFGVVSPDSRIQFTEYLGGGRIPISIQQVAQTSQGTEQSPLGAVAGYSLSSGYSKFSKGFVEHGYILTLGCIRQVHSYSQGVSRLWSRLERKDFYDPLFATIGEQPVYTSELFYEAGKGLKEDVFGYQEAWADYRNRLNTITAEMRPQAENSLDIWHFGDNYGNAPVLADEFINETTINVDRTLSVPSSSISQFIGDFWFDTQAIRVMPTYSVPGLIDHH